jgi:hypothetical protein
MKNCIICGDLKPLNFYYKHKKMADGHLNKCIECCKYQSRERENYLRKTNPEWVEKDKERAREKYYRLEYVKKYKTYTPSKIFRAKYPEKYKAHQATSKIKPVIKGNQLHHWSYNEQHQKDVIELSRKNHMLLHRHMVYDNKLFMYRNKLGKLLDSKQAHIDLLNSVL